MVIQQICKYHFRGRWFLDSLCSHGFDFNKERQELQEYKRI